MGIATAGYLDKSQRQLDLNGNCALLANEYDPTPVLVAEHLIGKVSDRAKDFTFIDFGAGKGRVVVVAAKYSFKTIIGIEHSRNLATTAQENIARFARRNNNAKPMEIVLGDATEWPLPPEPSVLFFFNPFQPALMEKVAARITESQKLTPRKLYLVFYNTRFYEDVFKRSFISSDFRREDI